jgi:peptidyl-prolyl cis-trans isomerase D
MLSLMRKHAGTWLIKIMLGAIIVVFSFWGVGSYTARKLNMVAEVNGDIITLTEYNKTLRTLREQVRQRFGGSMNEDLLKVMQLEKQAVDQLVNERIMSQEAQKLGFSVSDEELAAAITAFPAFQNGGKFDRRRYENLLASNRLSVEEFEQMQRSTMLTSKLRSFITSNARVAESEVLDWYNWTNTTVSIDYVVFAPADYQDLAPTAEAIAAYYGENRESYRTDPLVKVRYLSFPAENYIDKVILAAEAAREYYESNRSTYEQKEMVEARHILIKVAADADDAAVAAARKKIDAIAAKIDAGEDFATLAKAYSEGPTGEKGGYLGSFPRGAMVKPFDEAAFALKTGEVSQPVRTDFGWHLIKAEKVTPAGVRPFEEVRSEIERLLIRSEAKDRAREAAEDAYDAIFEPDDFAAVAADRGLSVAEAEFDRKGPAEAGREAEKLATAAFALEVGDISEVIELPDGYYLLVVEDKIPGEIPELELVKAKIRETLTRQMQEEKATAACEAFLAAAREKGEFVTAAQDNAVTVTTAGFFPRQGPIPELGAENAIVAAAFELTAEGQIADKPVQGSGGQYAIRLVQRKLPDVEGLSAQKEGIRNQLEERKRSTLFGEWLAKAREASEITIESKYTDGENG